MCVCVQEAVPEYYCDLSYMYVCVQESVPDYCCDISYIYVSRCAGVSACVLLRYIMYVCVCVYRPNGKYFRKFLPGRRSLRGASLSNVLCVVLSPVTFWPAGPAVLLLLSGAWVLPLSTRGCCANFLLSPPADRRDAPSLSPPPPPGIPPPPPPAFLTTHSLFVFCDSSRR